MHPRDDNYRLHYKAHPLEVGEREVASWAAAQGANVLVSAGGRLVLTTRRVLFEPIRTPKELLLGPVAKLFGLGEAAEIVNAGINAAGSLEQWSKPVTDIAGVDPVGDGSRLRITLRTGESWEFGIADGLWSLRGGSGSRARRDEAVAAIRAVATGGSATATNTSSSQVGPDPEFEQARSQAASLGKEVVIDEEGPFRLRATPDGWLRFSMGYVAQVPANATRPSNLLGKWRLRDWHDPELVNLVSDGTVAGQVQLFGALPPLAVSSGLWWWEQPPSRLTLALVFILPELTDLRKALFEVGYGIAVKFIGQSTIVGDLESDENQEVSLERIST